MLVVVEVLLVLVLVGKVVLQGVVWSQDDPRGWDAEAIVDLKKNYRIERLF